MFSKVQFNKSFWQAAFEWTESVSPKVIGQVIIFTGISVFTTFLALHVQEIELSVGVLEVSGGVIGLLLIVRTNAGYDRWWEARKLWGGIVNQSRNLAIGGMNYGETDSKWREEFLNKVSEFPFLVCRILREGRDKNIAFLCSAQLSQMLSQAYRQKKLDGFELSLLEKQRASLIDHLGACERILKSPLPKVLDIKVRRFLFLYLTLLPLGLVDRIGWYTPALTFFISYSVLALDQIGVELQNPFSLKHLSALPLDDISFNISKQILYMKEDISGQNKKVKVEPPGHSKIYADETAANRTSSPGDLPEETSSVL